MPLAIQGHRSGGSLETQPRAGRRAAAEESAVGKPTRAKAVPDRGQRALLLPVSVAGRQTQLVARSPYTCKPASPHSSNKRPRARQSIVNELISREISECLRAYPRERWITLLKTWNGKLGT